MFSVNFCYKYDTSTNESTSPSVYFNKNRFKSPSEIVLNGHKILQVIQIFYTNKEINFRWKVEAKSNN